MYYYCSTVTSELQEIDCKFIKHFTNCILVGLLFCLNFISFHANNWYIFSFVARVTKTRTGTKCYAPVISDINNRNRLVFTLFI